MDSLTSISTDLGTVMQRLYDSEINCAVSCFWDGGWDVKLGDEMNGFRDDTTVLKLEEAAQWLHEAAHRHFPNSVYALTYPLDPARAQRPSIEERML